ncbi:hypothetical protein LINPERPRIM_LOCUS4449 [Linum perenne]
MRHDIAKLLENGQEATARIRVCRNIVLSDVYERNVAVICC